MSSGSATQRLADALLGQPVIDWLQERRAAGTQSFRQLAAALKDATDKQVDVTDQTIANWLTEAEKAA